MILARGFTSTSILNLTSSTKKRKSTHLKSLIGIEPAPFHSTLKKLCALYHPAKKANLGQAILVYKPKFRAIFVIFISSKIDDSLKKISHLEELEKVMNHPHITQSFRMEKDGIFRMNASKK